MKKRGQTTAFIIIALVIVVFAVILYFFYPRISSLLGIESEPNAFLASCIEPSVAEGIDLLSKQGGYAAPEGYITYKGNNVKYLCYTSQYYIPCYVQQPLLRQHFEQELGKLTDSKAKECIAELRKYYQDRGYEVSNPGNVKTNVQIIPDNVRVVVEAPLSISKETTDSFRDFQFVIQSNMYTLLMTATSIIDFESTLGNAETLLYVQYYPNLKIEKDKLGDGSTIYTVTDVNSEESFTFASRSLAWPGGYGLTA